MKKIPFYRQLNTKLIIFFILISCAPIIFFGYDSLTTVMDSISFVLIRNSVEVGNRTSAEIKSYIETIQQIVNPTMNAKGFWDDDIEKIQQKLKTLERQHVDLLNLYVIDENQKILFSAETPELSQIVLCDKEIKRVHSISYYDCLAYVFDEKSASLVIARPADINKTRVYLCVEISLKPVRVALEKIGMGTTERAYILSRDNKLITSTSKVTPDEMDYVHKILATAEGFGGFEIYKDKVFTNIAISLPISRIGWKFLVTQNAAEALAIGEKMKNRIRWILGLCFVFAFFFGFLISKKISHPINVLHSGAEKITEGNLETRIQLFQRDEIGDLADAFNNMTENLQNTIRSLDRKVYELSALFEISKATSYVQETHKLLQIIIEKTLKTFNAEKCLIFTTDDGNSNEIQLEAAVRWDEDQEKAVSYLPTDSSQIQSGEGISGKVLESRNPILFNDVLEEKELFNYLAEDEDVHQEQVSLMSVPLNVKDKALGVMNVINKQDHTQFTATDLELLNAISTHVAMTIQNAKLYELAITDGLTKLYIVRYFKARLQEEMGRIKRYGQTLSLIMFDIDHFKNFNDSYGHQTGDVVIAGVANIIKETVRGIDIPARYGGEEFVTILPETDREGAFIMAERLRKNVENHRFPGPSGQQLQVTISLGICEFPTQADEMMKLIKNADVALYRSKQRGRNVTSIYDESMGNQLEPSKMKEDSLNES